MRQVLQSFWSINVTDIESTLKQVLAQVSPHESLYMSTACHPGSKTANVTNQHQEVRKKNDEQMPSCWEKRLCRCVGLWPSVTLIGSQATDRPCGATLTYMILILQVLSEPGVPERDLKERAKALKKMGSIFQVQPVSRVSYLSAFCHDASSVPKKPARCTLDALVSQDCDHVCTGSAALKRAKFRMYTHITALLQSALRPILPDCWCPSS